MRFFDKTSLSIKQSRLAQPTINELADEYRKDKIITNILDNYNEANTDTMPNTKCYEPFQKSVSENLVHPSLKDFKP